MSSLREIPPLEGLSQVKRILAVASGKGGVGKSTVTLLLAHSLKRQGLKVGIADCDIYGASIPLLLKEKQEPQIEEKQFLLPPEKNGLAYLSMALLIPEDDVPIIWRGPMLHKMVHQFLFGTKWGERDVLLLDLPPGTGDVQLTITQTVPVTAAVIVTTPQEISLADVQKGLAMFEKYQIPLLGVIENMSYFVCPKCRQKDSIFPKGELDTLLEKYQVEKLWEIPLDESLAQGGEGLLALPKEWQEELGAKIWNKLKLLPTL